MWFYLLSAFVLLLALFALGRTWLGWVASGALLLLGWGQTGVEYPLIYWASTGLFGAIALVAGFRPLRAPLVTRHILPLIAPILPSMSETEKVAIEAGTVWWEAAFFTGNPKWKQLLDFKLQELTPAEQKFIDVQCEEVCAMLSDWEVNLSGDLPSAVWDYLKKEGFFGMIIPEGFGGLGFSAVAHSAVVTKLSSRSVPLAVTVMVPNSLGPAELLLHYGTEEQKDYYLPRLARGDEVPAFALTEPQAGSDAGSMRATGVICRGQFEGEDVLGIRLNWDKRYITLAPVATVLGLAFKLQDPDGLLGDKPELGITCALVPADLPGVTTGERHDPLGCNFMNGPTQGVDVFVPIESIIGGKEQAGQGWLMLMQSLAAGRGISLPSMSAGAAKLVTRTVGAYSSVREQFNVSIGKFEGIQERLARIAGLTYGMDAARNLTSSAVDAGEKPSVASAIVKAYLTESMRTLTNDGMDIVGGAGICSGPRNILGPGYAALPIGITVEGANILTRSMIIFGQGALRCHPHVQDEMRGAEEGNLKLFDRSFWGHVGFVFTNAARSLVHALTRSAFAPAPVSGPSAKYYKQIGRLSSSFAVASDVAMGTLGGSLKFRESITGRLSDVLSWQFLASAALKRFEAEGRNPRDLPYLQWFCEHALHEAQEAYIGVCENMPLRPAGWLLRGLAFPLGRPWSPPSDSLCRRVALGIVDGSEARESLTTGIYIPGRDEQGLGTLEDAYAKVVAALAVQKKIATAVETKQLERKPRADLVTRARTANIINDADLAVLEAAKDARFEAITVDSFGPERWAPRSA
ncbi:MAG: acyl-CoA dehydrogenase [Planctomycetota bacterium]|jgi:acyl-CoA dehydrogenase